MKQIGAPKWNPFSQNPRVAVKQQQVNSQSLLAGWEATAFQRAVTPTGNCTAQHNNKTPDATTVRVNKVQNSKIQEITVRTKQDSNTQEVTASLQQRNSKTPEAKAIGVEQAIKQKLYAKSGLTYPKPSGCSVREGKGIHSHTLCKTA